MKYRNFLLSTLAFTMGLHAQYRTETFKLYQGWSSFYLNVDTEERTIEEVFSSATGVEQVWQWDPSDLYTKSEDDGTTNLTPEWKVWRSDDTAGSDISILKPNCTYRVKMPSGSGTTTLDVKGKVVEPTVKFSSHGLNYVGFPLPEGKEVEISTLFSGESTYEGVEIFQYAKEGQAQFGGPVMRGRQLTRGEAIWVKSDQFDDYYGPLEVDVLLDNGLNFGDSGTTKRIQLKNRSQTDIDVTITTEASESSPENSAKIDAVPLTVQDFVADGATYSYTDLGGGRTISIPANSSTTLTLGIDRTSLSGVDGAQFASLLRIKDKKGLTEIYLPVSAEKGSLSGLWVGEAYIKGVENHIERVERDSDGNLMLDSDNNPISAGSIKGMSQTDQEFKLRLIVHVDEAGQARLLSQAYAGLAPNDNEQVIISNKESALDPDRIGSAIRLTSSHFPLDMVAGISGAFAPGETLTTSVQLAYDHRSNPFVHTYHPDHDNKDALFSSVLPAGQESYQVDRKLTLKLSATDTLSFGSSFGNSILTGTYEEIISGLHKNSITTSGSLYFSKVSDAKTFLSIN